MERRSKEDFPMVMNVKDVMEILGIGKAAAYELMESEGFPCIKIGRLKKVNRDLFFDWLNKIAWSLKTPTVHKKEEKKK